jgi:hypothetical protein
MQPTDVGDADTALTIKERRLSDLRAGHDIISLAHHMCDKVRQPADEM